MNERGPYLTHSRAEELVATIAELEGRLTARIEAAEERAARAEGAIFELVRRVTSASLDVYREIRPQHDNGSAPPAPTERPR